MLGEDGIRLRDECQDIGAEDWLPVLDGAALVADDQTCGRRLPGPCRDGGDQGGGKGEPSGQAAAPR